MAAALVGVTIALVLEVMSSGVVRQADPPPRSE
jgi:hypothetical protein